MAFPAQFLNASDAAQRLGVSAKALRLYEERGLLSPVRTAAGWRTYGPEQLRIAGEIAALRGLGFSLGQVARVLQGKPDGLEPALAAHQTVLEGRVQHLAGTIDRVRGLRDSLARGEAPSVGQLATLMAPDAAPPGIAFDLPWPWGGERFELQRLQPLTYIIGPLGSGKTRLAQRLAETIPDAGFLGLDRLADASVSERLGVEPARRARVEATLTWLLDDGATASDALLALLTGLEAETPAVLVVDMIEQGLDQSTQQALIAHLRRRGPAGRKLFVLTRSSAILDLAAMGPDETIIFCPANHSPPSYVAPYPGAAGYEAVATCLASPEVRARTAGVIAWRPEVA